VSFNFLRLVGSVSFSVFESDFIFLGGLAFTIKEVVRQRGCHTNTYTHTSARTHTTHSFLAIFWSDQLVLKLTFDCICFYDGPITRKLDPELPVQMFTGHLVDTIGECTLASST
jgi:hypothetical protein